MLRGYFRGIFRKEYPEISETERASGETDGIRRIMLGQFHQINHARRIMADGNAN